MLKLVASPEQRKFGEDKRDTLTAQCRRLQGQELVQRRLPEGPLRLSRDGEPGQNYLCAGLEHFLHAYGPDIQGDGPTDSAKAAARRDDGVDRCR